MGIINELILYNVYNLNAYKYIHKICGALRFPTDGSIQRVSTFAFVAFFTERLQYVENAVVMETSSGGRNWSLVV